MCVRAAGRAASPLPLFFSTKRRVPRGTTAKRTNEHKNHRPPTYDPACTDRHPHTWRAVRVGIRSQAPHVPHLQQTLTVNKDHGPFLGCYLTGCWASRMPSNEVDTDPRKTENPLQRAVTSPRYRRVAALQQGAWRGTKTLRSEFMTLSGKRRRVGGDT